MGSEVRGQRSGEKTVLDGVLESSELCVLDGVLEKAACGSSLEIHQESDRVSQETRNGYDNPHTLVGANLVFALERQRSLRIQREVQP
jgi:hypothetical protein